VFDGDRFKKLNDTHGHAEGDKAIQHFGKVVMDAARELDLPMRGFRNGGDEIAFAAPVERAAEFRDLVEQRSRYTKGDVTTQLTGAVGPTFEAADAELLATKAAKKRADPTLLRAGETVPEVAAEVKPKTTTDENGVVLYANPIGPALKELARYPKAATLAGVGALLSDSDNKDLQKTAMPIFALAALSAIGSRRLGAAGDFLGDHLLQQLQKSTAGTAVARFFHPDALLSPEVRQAISDFEHARSRAGARANEFARGAQQLGPQGDRAVSDVLEGEGWEDTSHMAPKDVAAVLTFATALHQEYEATANELVSSGARTVDELLAGYAGPRRYAYYEAQAAQVEGGVRRGDGSPRISGVKHRTLDEPIRQAQAALDEAKASGDAQRIQDATDALDQAKAVQLSRRVELGEIREASYRAAQGIERAYSDAAAARLFGALKDIPGVVHPEWKDASDELQTARTFLKQKGLTPADRQAAEALRDQALVKINDLRRLYERKGGEFVSLPDTRGLGMLRGAIVQRDVAHSLVGFTRSNAYTKLLRAWKETKTVFNPGTHQGNILSNVTFAHMEGLPMWEQPQYLTRASKDMRTYGPATRALAEGGILDVNAVTAEGQGVATRDLRRQEGLEAMLPTTRPETAKVLREQGITEASIAQRRSRRIKTGVAAGAALGAAKFANDENPEDSAIAGVLGGVAGGLLARRGLKGVRELYSNEDNIFRAAIWLKKVDDGMTPSEATSYARNALGNFRSRSPALNAIRLTASPFILYPAKALPRFAANVVDHPWRYVALMALWGGLNELSKHEVGEVDEHDVKASDRRPFGYALPGFTQLPFTNERGEHAAVDMARWTPMSAVTTAAPPGSAPASFDERIPDIFRAGGPLIDVAARFGANVDAYTGRPAYARDYPFKQNATQFLRDAAGEALPSALDFHAERIREDVANRDFDKLKNDALGPTGLRPRFVRPGANAIAAKNQLTNSLREMKQAFRRDMRNNQNPGRVPVLRDRYLSRIRQALDNFRTRAGMEPPTDAVRDALDLSSDGQ